MLEAGRFTLGAGFSRLVFTLGLDFSHGVFFTFGVCFFTFGAGLFTFGCVFALVPFMLGAFHMGFSTDVLVDLEEEQGSGSSEHETTTKASMLPTTPIGS